MMILSHRFAFIGAFAVLAPLALAGCGDSVTRPIPPTDTSVNGEWQRTGEVPGSSERWALSLSGTSIAAVGTWTGEACCAGDIVGSGTVSGDSIHLDLKFFDSGNAGGTPRFTEHVDGVQPTIDDIVGTATRGDASSPIHMQRTVNVAPSAAKGW
jgi:hypothetical protein